jgi:peptidyl-prolyl cis-trans isomerase D
MLNSFRTKKSNIFVWILLGLLIVGLAGFGIGAGGGLGSSEVAQVGDRGVDSADFARAVDQEIRAVSTQVGRALTLEEARQFGLDRVALARLVNNAALDGEAARLGLSTGDATVRTQLEGATSFQSNDGAFDRDAYMFMLERMGMSPAEFEAELRSEASRDLLGAGIAATVAMPDSAAEAVLGHLGERRGFDWLGLGESHLETPVSDPDDAALEAYHAENSARYTRPETRRIVYAMATPETVAAGIEIPEDELRAAYDAAPDAFGSPEQRILDRIGFRDMDEAEAARARLDAGEIDFDALATERGLSAAEIEQGTLASEDVEQSVREAVFGDEGPGIFGPVQTALGPALYRVNAILAANQVSFEEARPELVESRARGAASDRILADIAVIEDLIAGGARIEEIASETVLELGEIAFNTASTGGLADDPAFRTAALAAEVGVETDLVELDGDGLVTLRVEEVEPPALIPLAEIRPEVLADWRADAVASALSGQAESWRAEIEGGLAFADLAERLGVVAQAATPMIRSDALPGTPPRLVSDIFAAEMGDVVSVPDGAGIILAQLTEVLPFDRDDTEMSQVFASLDEELAAQAANDIRALFTGAMRDAAGVSVNQDLLTSTLDRLR